MQFPSLRTLWPWNKTDGRDANARPEAADLEQYEVTPYGRRRRRPRSGRVVWTVSIAGAAVAVVWLLI